MPSAILERPAATEYVPYFGRYVEQVPAGDVMQILGDQIRETVALLAPLDAERANHRYAPDKWSIKEVVGHISDAERIFVYRALCFARGETANLPAFDENEYMRRAKFSARTLPDLVAELESVRAATLTFFASLDDEEMMRRGISNGREFTVRSLAYIIAGHEAHHARILMERYLVGSA
jgi:hypothetical protein